MKVTAALALALVCLTAGLHLLDASQGLEETAATGHKPHAQHSRPGSSAAGSCSRHALLYGQIHHDLMHWATEGISESNIEASRKLCERPPGNYICVLVEDGQVFLTSLHMRKDTSMAQMFAGFLLELYEVAQLYSLPDMEFVIHVGDMPVREQLPKAQKAQEHVLLAYYKMWDTQRVSPQILIPFSGHFRCYSNAFDSMLANISSFSYEAVPWEQRKQVAVTRYNTFCPPFKGSFLNTPNPSSQRPCGREELPRVSNSSKGLLDARNIDQGGFLSMVQHARHRYIVSTDGWSASSKLEKYMLMGSTILKQASPLIAYYYAALVPWVHYVPFYELSSDDIMEAIEWLKENDDVARRIARNAKTFALEHLTRPARLCYYQELFTRLGKLYRYKPSCSKRAMCVPLLDELIYLGCFTPGTCNVHGALWRIHGKAIDRALCPAHKYAEANFFHGHSIFMGTPGNITT